MTCRIQGILNANNCSLPTANVNFYNTYEEIIASGYTDLFDGTLSTPIRYTEARTVVSYNEVWSGTDPSGLRAFGGGSSANCNSWTSGGTGDSGVFGNPNQIASQWSNAGGAGTNNCSESKPIYCFARP